MKEVEFIEIEIMKSQHKKKNRRFFHFHRRNDQHGSVFRRNCRCLKLKFHNLNFCLEGFFFRSHDDLERTQNKRR